MVKGVEKGNNLKIENFVKIKVYFPLKQMKGGGVGWGGYGGGWEGGVEEGCNF